MASKNKAKLLARTLQAETGWSYQACRNLLDKHGGDYDAALADAKARPARKEERDV